MFFKLRFHSKYRNLDKQQQVLLTHGDSITNVGNQLKVSAISASHVIAGIWNGEYIFGVQFHPEVDITTNGQKMLHNFLIRICGLIPSYTMECRKESCMKYIREKVGDSQVLVLVSGGVDSTVCAALLTRALQPNQIHAVHIDNGKH